MDNDVDVDDEDTAFGEVTFNIKAGDEVVCDWYNITPADDEVTTLPTTGAGGVIHSPGLGVSAVLAACAFLALAGTVGIRRRPERTTR